MANTDKVITNLIQGVSQQAAIMRRDSQCEAQFDCINSPKDGAVARPGLDVIKYHYNMELNGAFAYELFRANEEHYVVFIRNGAFVIFDLNTGNLCEVAQGPASQYLADVGGDARSNIVVQTVDDYTFVANRRMKPKMHEDLTSVRPKEAFLFFRGGAYLTNYQMAVTFGGKTYRYAYETPDNSTAANAKFINTNSLAATFYTAANGNYTYNAPQQWVESGAQFGDASFGGDNNVTGNLGRSVDGKNSGYPGAESVPYLTGAGGGANLGFATEINGNLLRIWHPEGREFELSASDGAGDSLVRAIGSTVKAFSELPQGGFPGYLVKVRPAGTTAAEYYVEYRTGEEKGWHERPAPGVKFKLDASTMPHALVNTGPGTFEFRSLSWSNRIAGDGVDTCKDPGFVGKYIQDIFYHKGRLGILTEATVDWSKARNPYTFFPDTAQAVLDDAPIGVTLAASEGIALTRRAVMVDESLFLWAQGKQFRPNSGNDPFKESTVDVPPTTSYEFAEHANFASVAQSIYFATEPSAHASVRNLTFQNGKTAGDIDVTAHVAAYIPSGVRKLSPTDTGSMLFVQTDGAPNDLFLYNYLVQNRQEVVQSAWNRWHLPKGTILWSSVWRMHLYVALQRADGIALLKLPLNTEITDPGGDYLTRLDMRVSEAECAVTYHADLDQTNISLPYEVKVEELGNFRVVLRENGVGAAHPYIRGREYPVESGEGARMVRVQGDLSGYKFYAGFRIESIRDESTFYLRGPDGVVPVDDLTIRSFRASHDRTAYYRVEVDQGQSRKKVYEFSPNVGGVGNSVLNGPVVLDTGKTELVGVEQLNEKCSIRLINDSPFPSRWQTAEYIYSGVLRAKPSRLRTGE